MSLSSLYACSSPTRNACESTLLSSEQTPQSTRWSSIAVSFAWTPRLFCNSRHTLSPPADQHCHLAPPAGNSTVRLQSRLVVALLVAGAIVVLYLMMQRGSQGLAERHSGWGTAANRR